MITMLEYRNASAAVEEVEELKDETELLNSPPNLNSPFISILPHTRFSNIEQGSSATVTIMLDPNLVNSAARVYRANRNSNYAFVELDTQVVDGRALAQTSEGGIFVAGTGVNYSLVVGVVVAAVVLVLVVTVVVGTVIYFVVRPEKWQSTKNNLKKTQMKVKRSFARQV